ncbi:MAG: sensor histidine kinase [Actinomycetota bacterium]|nr:sensor histidine kinase [Actinomycetota bacterium]
MTFFDKIKPRSFAFDALLAAVILTLALTGTAEIDADVITPFTRESDAFHVALLVLMTVPIALRRVYTIPVYVIVLLTWIADRGLDYPDSIASAGVGIMFYTLGAELSRRRSLRIGGASVAVIVGWTVLGVITLPSVSTGSLITTLISTLTPLLLGREMHQRRGRVAELKERLKRAEIEREEKARRAVADERARIARELHDVVAHQMTVMTLQADGARRIADGTDPRVVEALETIGDTGREALAEMRRMVGLLRQPDDESETRPLPQLSDIDALVEGIRAAGVAVDLKIEGDVRRLPEVNELSAFRIVQESLTNAVRHGGPDVSAKVTLDYGEESLDVLVVDDGRGASALSEDGVGHGIVGMRERVAVLGGEFRAGPNAGGGYRVHATIPVEA